MKETGIESLQNALYRLLVEAEHRALKRADRMKDYERLELVITALNVIVTKNVDIKFFIECLEDKEKYGRDYYNDFASPRCENLDIDEWEWIEGTIEILLGKEAIENANH